MNMKIKQYLFLLLAIWTLNGIHAQINNFDDFIIKNEELKMLTVRIAKNYIMTGVLPANKKIRAEYEADQNKFNDIIVSLTEKAPNEEIEIELQKLSLSWMMLDRIIKRKYDILAASKVLDYSDKMVEEIDNITNMVMKTTKKKSVRLLKASSDGRMYSQRLLLYYIANKVKIRNKNVKIRFEDSKEKLYGIIQLLSKEAETDPDLKADEGFQLYIDMIKDSYGKVRKTLTLKAKVHALTANLIVNQLTENFDLLTNMIYEKFNG